MGAQLFTNPLAMAYLPGSQPSQLLQPTQCHCPAWCALSEHGECYFSQVPSTFFDIKGTDLFVCISHMEENADSKECISRSLVSLHHQLLQFCRFAKRLLGSNFKRHKHIRKKNQEISTLCSWQDWQWHHTSFILRVTRQANLPYWRWGLHSLKTGIRHQPLNPILISVLVSLGQTI